MKYELLIRIILDLIIILLGLFIILWKGYFNEKGKNYATKEDIEEITKKIETVKNEIGIHSQLKLSYYNDRKKAALDFLNSVSIWLDFTLRPLGILYNNPTDIETLSSIIKDLKDRGAMATSNFWNVFIYYENEKLGEVVDELYGSCIKLHNLTSEFLINLERKAIQVKQKLEIFEVVKDRSQRQEINADIKILHKEINELIEKYSKEKKDIDDQATLDRYRYIKALNKIFEIKNPVHNNV